MMRTVVTAPSPGDGKTAILATFVSALFPTWLGFAELQYVNGFRELPRRVLPWYPLCPSVTWPGASSSSGMSQVHSAFLSCTARAAHRIPRGCRHRDWR
jgi:hypothetical protein